METVSVVALFVDLVMARNAGSIAMIDAASQRLELAGVNVTFKEGGMDCWVGDLAVSAQAASMGIKQRDLEAMVGGSTDPKLQDSFSELLLSLHHRHPTATAQWLAGRFLLKVSKVERMLDAARERRGIRPMEQPLLFSTSR